jgi:hypothetical protein
MVRLVYTLLVVALITGGSLARAKDSGGGSLVDSVSSERFALERLDDARRELLRQQTVLKAQLSELATQIQKRKANITGTPLLPDLVLNDLLRRSQALSESLTVQSHEIEALEQARRVRVLKLIKLYDELVEQAAVAARTADRTRQAEQLQVLAKARAEREALRVEQPLMPVKPLLFTPQDLLVSDDPEELRERADVVYDEHDRYLKQLAALDQRIADLEAEVRLNRELRDFVGEQALFGEESRTLRLHQSKEINAEPTGTGKSGSNVDVYTAADPAGGSNEPSSTTISGWARAPLGVGEDRINLNTMSITDQIQTLKQRRTQVQQEIRKLQVLYDRISEKAEASTGR